MTHTAHREHAVICIVGAGSIGLAFAIRFARAGYQVRVFDPIGASLDRAPALLDAKLDVVREVAPHVDLSRVTARITFVADLEAAVDHAALVIECAPERIEVKRELFSALETVAPDDCVLASASSALTISNIAGHLATKSRTILAHPANPPHIIDMIELVPAPFTSERTLTTATELFESTGMAPVHVTREVEGFIMNRLQGAVLREAYCLVRDGVATVADVDTVMRAALAPRWAVAGPFETADLNTQGGIAAHAEKLGPAYERMGAERGQHDPWVPELVAEVTAQRRREMPLEQWQDRVLWREREVLKRLSAGSHQAD